MDAQPEQNADGPRLDPPHCASCGVPLPYGGGITLNRWRALCCSCYQHPCDYWTRIHKPQERQP